MRDLGKRISVAQSLAPAARTASANGTGVDLANYDGAVVVVETGTITDGTHAITVEESTDNSTFTAVAAADLHDADGDGTILPSIGAADDNKVYEIGYFGTKRYVRAVTTVSGTTTGGVYVAHVVRGFAHKQPV
jgi:hypothetical protein